MDLSFIHSHKRSHSFAFSVSSSTLPSSSSGASYLRLSDIHSHPLSLIAQQWKAPSSSSSSSSSFSSADLISRIWREYLSPSAVDGSVSFRLLSRSLHLLDLSLYFECLLWPSFNVECSFEHVMSLLALVDWKARQHLASASSVWDLFAENEEGDKFVSFLVRVLKMKSECDMSAREASLYLSFFSHAFESIEHPLIQRYVLRLISLPLWRALSKVKRNELLHQRGHEKLLPLWLKIVSQCQRIEADPDEPATATNKVTFLAASIFLPRLLCEFVTVLYSIPALAGTENNFPEVAGSVRYVEQFLSLCIECLSQLPTRRFFHALLVDCHLLAVCRAAPLVLLPTSMNRRILTLIDQFAHFVLFDINNETAEVVDVEEMRMKYEERINHLQNIARIKFPLLLKPLYLTHLADLDNHSRFARYLDPLDDHQLLQLCVLCNLLDEEEPEQSDESITRGVVTTRAILNAVPADRQRALLIEILTQHHLSHVHHTRLADNLPIYPDESLLFDPDLMPMKEEDGEVDVDLDDAAMQCARSLPRLTLQYLSLSDYLWRHFTLYRVESAYTVREEIFDSVSRIQPRLSSDEKHATTTFTAFCRLACPIVSFVVRDVPPPPIGLLFPREVRADLTLDLSSFKGAVRGEWEAIRSSDILILLSIVASKVADSTNSHALSSHQAKSSALARHDHSRYVEARSLIRCVRGCSVEKISDEFGNVAFFSGQRKSNGLKGTIRHYQVLLDPIQFNLDKKSNFSLLYSQFNLVIRRRPKESNFKEVLESIRNALVQCGHLQTTPPVPSFLSQLVLGYGDPLAAHYSHLERDEQVNLHFNDLFLDIRHVRSSFASPMIFLSSRKPVASIANEQADTPSFQSICSNSIDQRNIFLQTAASLSRRLKLLASHRSCLAADESGLESQQPSFQISFPLGYHADLLALHQLPLVEEQKQPTSPPPEMPVEEPDIVLDHKVDPQLASDAGSSTTVGEFGDPSIDIEMKGKEASTYIPIDLDELENISRESVRSDDFSTIRKQAFVDKCADWLVRHPDRSSELCLEACQLLYNQLSPEARSSFLLASTSDRRTIRGSLMTNNVRFTPLQVEAIQSGCRKGLTLIIGPPGCGKTDVATQIIDELSQMKPEQRILVITHSNHALNDIFSKLVGRSIDSRYLLRVGYGGVDDTEDQPQLELDFSANGRVVHMLRHQQSLLQQIGALAASLGFSAEDASYSCSTAASFFLLQILPRWRVFAGICAKAKMAHLAVTSESKEQLKTYHAVPATSFPFSTFFSSSSPSLFSRENFDRDLVNAIHYFDFVMTLMRQIEECRPFEVLRSFQERSKWLISKHAKVVAMTCTHAAIRRAQFLSQHLAFDTVVMEESAQSLEIETVLPLTLKANATNALRRVVMLGDHRQLPPVVKHRGLSQYSHFDTSFFTRMLRLGVPAIQLDAQGRSRPEIAALWSWRYEHIFDLPITRTTAEYIHANVGMLHTYQCVDVGDLNGQGETCPLPHVYQNLAEAEYAVAIYQYLRLMGYQRHQVVILTSYNGQKALLREIVDTRCSRHPLFGSCRVATVDQFQGQQVDIAIFSMVRTKSPGHIRDVRRLVVALSRARLGLYVLCRRALYENVYELNHAFSLLYTRSHRLALLPHERCSSDQPFFTPRLVHDAVENHRIRYVYDCVDLASMVSKLADTISNELSEYQRRVAAHERFLQTERERETRELITREEARKTADEEQRLSEENERCSRETERLQAELQLANTAAFENDVNELFSDDSSPSERSED